MWPLDPPPSLGAFDTFPVMSGLWDLSSYHMQFKTDPMMTTVSRYAVWDREKPQFETEVFRYMTWIVTMWTNVVCDAFILWYLPKLWCDSTSSGYLNIPTWRHISRYQDMFLDNKIPPFPCYAPLQLLSWRKNNDTLVVWKCILAVCINRQFGNMSPS